MDNRDECEHDNTTEILFDAKIHQHMRGERKYEVVYCLKCDRLINLYQNNPMTGNDIEAMFMDIKKGIEAVDAAIDDLHNAINETLKAFKDV